MDEKKKDLLKEQGEAKAMGELQKADEIPNDEIEDVAGGFYLDPSTYFKK